MAEKSPDTRSFTSVSDPTPLTTQQILREIASLKELFETRLDAMDKAILLLQQFTDRQPTTTAVAQSVECLRDLHDEKFNSIASRFNERDIRAEKMFSERKTAGEIAFTAYKDASDKSETFFTKQIDAMDAKITDLKERMQGLATWPMALAGMSVLIAFGSLVAIIIKLSH